MAGTAVDFLLENLKQLMNGGIWLILDEKDQIESIYKELGFLRTFLNDSVEKHYEHEKVKTMATRIRDVVYEAEEIIDLLVIRTVKSEKRSMDENIGHVSYPCYRLLPDIRKEIEYITQEVREIYDKKLYGIGVLHVGMSFRGRSSRASAPNVEEAFVIGFDQEVETIKDRLTGQKKQLEVISIVGMAGLGKTTLARKLYNDPLIVYYFDIRGWTYVSQVYRKEDLLHGILSSVEIHARSNERLGEELYKCLKRKRYLIVIDDIWNIEAWDDLKKSFPDDNNGSRILFTSRLKDVALYAQPDKQPHFLRKLTHDESWLLLQRKVFCNESCPLDLVNIGKQIAKKCQGLPLAIVVVAGLLAKTDKMQDWWKQVAERVSSYVVSHPEQCLDILALSYNHLPNHLKLCFLYLGAFPEDYEIPVRKLIWLWVAEGFIKKIGQKSLEDVAEEYLLDLIDRSLVLVAQKKSSGGIRSCHVHDLLRDLCLKKAKEENFLLCDLCMTKTTEKNFLQHIYGYEEVSSPPILIGYEEGSSSPRPIEYEEVSSSTRSIRNKRHCLCIHSCLFSLLHGMGLRKAKKENSLQQIYEYGQVSADAVASSSIPTTKKEYSLQQVYENGQVSAASAVSYSSIPLANKQRRLCIHSRVFPCISLKSFTPHIRSFLCFASSLSPLSRENLSFVYQEFKLLRVLDLSTISIQAFPSDIVQLVLLRYLALKGKHLSPPASISKLWNLETLVISESMGISIRPEIWKMVKLRHLYIKGQNHIFEVPNDGYPSVLDNLQTISQVCPSRACRAVLAKTPNLRKLGFCGRLTSNGQYRFLDIDFLNHLESLKLFNGASPLSYWNIRLEAYSGNGLGNNVQPYRLEGVKFPPSLKRLTLSLTYLDWKEMVILGMLPNLEALKLEFLACYGPLWETSDGGFRRLKYLRLNCMNIEQWNASGTHFPSLQHLVLRECEKLKEIPYELGDIPTLQTIDVSWCRHSAVSSARQIQEEQQSMGNDWLQIFINPSDRELTGYA